MVIRCLSCALEKQPIEVQLNFFIQRRILYTVQAHRDAPGRPAPPTAKNQTSFAPAGLHALQDVRGA